MSIREYPTLGQYKLEAAKINKMGVLLMVSGGVDVFDVAFMPTRIDEEISVNYANKIALGFPSEMKEPLAKWLADYALGFKDDMQYIASQITSMVREIVKFKVKANFLTFKGEITEIRHNEKDGNYHFFVYPDRKDQNNCDNFLFGYSGHGVLNGTLKTPVSLQILDAKKINNSISVNGYTPGNTFNAAG